MILAQKDIDYYNKAYAPDKWHKLGCWHKAAIGEMTLAGSEKILDVGCGQALMLRGILATGKAKEENLHGIDQSEVAVQNAQKALPKAQFHRGSAENLSFWQKQFDIVTLLEVIEHLQDPVSVLSEIYSVMKPNGKLYITFPNYFHPIWLIVRILAEKLNRPNWVVLQPTDKIYNVRNVIGFAKQAGFKFIRGNGSNYFPPVLDRIEKGWMTKIFNFFGLWWLSYHPVLVFEKK